MDPLLLEHLAQHRAGIVGRRHLVDAGVTPNRVDRALARGRLIPIAPGVYRVAGAPWTRRAAQHAALLVAGPAACLARWSAAELCGIADQRRGPLQVLVPHERRSTRAATRLVTAQRSRTLQGDERRELEGLAVTSGARTLLDLAPAVDVDHLAELAATGIRRRVCTVGELAAVLARHPGAQGRRRLVDALDVLGDDGARARAEVEVAALQTLVAAGLPRPVVAHRIHGPGGHLVAEVDLAYPELRLAIEIDGFLWHSTPAQKRADEERQNRLILAGWTVLRFSAAQVRSDPQSFVETVAGYLATTTISR